MIAYKMIARDLMTSPVVTVTAESSLQQALQILDQGGFSQLPVVQQGKPIALLTEADVRRAILQNRQDRPVRELASALQGMVDADAFISDVLQQMQTCESLLVIGEDAEMLGIITHWDLIVLARPFLMVTEIELLLRQVVSLSYQAIFGPDWWPHVREELRQRAEEEHRPSEPEVPDAEHMLGHTSFWALIEIYRDIKPDFTAEQFQVLDRIRELRNRIAHHYKMSEEELQTVVQSCIAARDALAVCLKLLERS